MTSDTRIVWEANKDDALLLLAGIAATAASTAALLRELGKNEPLLNEHVEDDETDLEWLEEAERRLSDIGIALTGAADEASVDDTDIEASGAAIEAIH